MPGLYLCGFLIPPVDGADFRAAFVANCLRGAFPPVDLRAVCLVRAILQNGLSFDYKELLGNKQLNVASANLTIKIIVTFHVKNNSETIDKRSQIHNTSST